MRVAPLGEPTVRTPSAREAAELRRCGRIAFGRREPGGAALWVMNGDGSDARRIGAGTSPRWSPGGRRLAFERDGGVWVAGADGTRARRLADGGDPAWSPHGRAIAFERRGGIYVMGRGGGVSRVAERGRQPSWSPDGARIAFVRRVRGVRQLHLVDARGGRARRVEHGELDDDAPAWSPDGRTIAVGTWDRAGGLGPAAELVLVAVDGAFVVTLGSGLFAEAYDPAWSPNGRRILFACRESAGAVAELCVMEADGGGDVLRLTANGADAERPAWQPGAHGL